MTADYFLKKDLIFIVFYGVEIVLEYNGNVGTHIDVFVRSNSKTFDDAWTLFTTHIQALCVASGGCQGVLLVEGIVQPECVRQQIPFIQHQNQAVLVEDLSTQMRHMEEKLSPMSKCIIDLFLKSSQHQVPRIVLFTTDDASMKQTLITNLVPGMKALQLHLLCEYKTQVHIVEGQPGCEVILEGKHWETIHGLVVEGLKWVFLAIKVGAHITMGIGDLVPNPSKAYAKAVSDSVGSCLPMDWATVTSEELVMDADSAVRTAQKEFAE
jgi:hypothetical protein